MSDEGKMKIVEAVERIAMCALEILKSIKTHELQVVLTEPWKGGPPGTSPVPSPFPHPTTPGTGYVSPDTGYTAADSTTIVHESVATSEAAKRKMG